MQPKGVVFEGKTLDEAVRKGMEALGLTRAEVMITVLEEGSGGFLGIGARPYRVRTESSDGSSRAQNGHWKSEKTTMVTRASRSPTIPRRSPT